MPPTQLPNVQVTVLQPTGPSSGTALNPTFTVADIVNGNYFVASGRDLVTVYNSDTSPHNLNVTSAPDSAGRLANIVNYVVPTGGFVEFQVLSTSLYTQTTGYVLLSADSTLVKFFVRSL